MELKVKRMLAGITALTVCLMISFAALGETTARDTEENGKIKMTEWVDENGEPAAGPEGYATVRYTYKREETTEMYFGTDGQPYKVAGGYYGLRTTKDGRGNILMIEYLDPDGERMLNRKGYAMVGMSYYGFGAVRAVTYYGLNKKSIMVPSLGYASVYTEYSNKTMTARTYRDTKGNPVDCADGYAVVKQKVDKRFRVLSIRYDHADGKPATGPDGWFRCVKDRDDQGRITTVKYYDVNDQLIDRGAGYAWEEYEYEGDSITRVTRYSLDGEKVTDEAGVATLVRETRDDRVVKERFLDREGKRINNGIGVAEILYSYDHEGSLEKVSYQDAEGNPTLCSLGYAGYRDEKDEDGTTVSRTYLGTDGLAMEIPGGYSEVRYQYDEMKQLVSTRYFDLNGKQIKAE